METEHLTQALLQTPDSLAARILEKAGAQAGAAQRLAARFIDRQPRVSGAAAQVLGRNLEALVERARKLREAGGDDLISSEHLVLALAEDPRFGVALMRDLGVTTAALEEAVRGVKGAAKAGDADAESKYEVLAKYSRDLTAEARAGRLDPVIGRDDEIRRVIQILSRRTKVRACSPCGAAPLFVAADVCPPRGCSPRTTRC